jgi:sorbitol/mannitol transport system substrate-binding protein
MTLKTYLLGACSALAMLGVAHAETTLTIATVNNGDMIRMQKLTDDFTSKNPDIKLEWVTLEENVLRQKVTTDIATKGGQYDVMTIGTYEVPICCQPFVAVFRSTASSMLHRSTAKARWSCTART